MKDLKITPALVDVDGTQVVSVNGNVIATVFDNSDNDVANMNQDEAKSNATIYADAHNTYQSTGMTASELAALIEPTSKQLSEMESAYRESVEIGIGYMKQRDELLEVLKFGLKAIKAVHSFGATTPIINRIEAAIQSVEQKQS